MFHVQLLYKESYNDKLKYFIAIQKVLTFPRLKGYYNCRLILRRLISFQNKSIILLRKHGKSSFILHIQLLLKFLFNFTCLKSKRFFYVILYKTLQFTTNRKINIGTKPLSRPVRYVSWDTSQNSDQSNPQKLQSFNNIKYE